MSASCLLVTVTRPYVLDAEVSRATDVVSLSVSDLTERMVANTSVLPLMKADVSLAIDRPKVHISKVCDVGYGTIEVFYASDGLFVLKDGKKLNVLKVSEKDELSE